MSSWNSVRYQPTPWTKWHMQDLPAWCTATDIDLVEACRRCGAPVLLLEYKHQQAPGMTAFQQRVLLNIGLRLAIPALEVRYLLKPDPGDPWAGDEILAGTVRLRHLADQHGRWTTRTLGEFAGMIADMHAAHRAGCGGE